MVCGNLTAVGSTKTYTRTHMRMELKRTIDYDLCERAKRKHPPELHGVQLKVRADGRTSAYASAECDRIMVGADRIGTEFELTAAQGRNLAASSAAVSSSSPHTASPRQDHPNDNGERFVVVVACRSALGAPEDPARVKDLGWMVSLLSG